MQFLFALCVLLVPIQTWAEDAQLAQLFSKERVAATIVIQSIKNGSTFVHDETRANHDYPPASTFKILNTLIGLEEGVTSTHATFIWDGVTREIPAWNKNQTLESAFQSSCVWCFQRIAQRIGATHYTRYLAEVGYGKLHEPFNAANFWLDGSLVISAFDQVKFLDKIYRRTLPFKPAYYDALQQFMLIERNSAYTLYAKSGWSTITKPAVGWYVGYIETSHDTWVFALNMDTPDQSALPLRQKMTLEALRAKRIIE